MSICNLDLVAQALRQPAVAAMWRPVDWDLLVRQARQADLLARLQCCFADAAVRVPAGPAGHFEAARVIAAAQHDEVRREVDHILAAVGASGEAIILLKGAAYVIADCASARGRLFADIDIMVARERLPEVEANLMMHGWATTHHAPYDQKYYRQWMHELPPMQHIRRRTVLDVHHSILPDTSRLKPAAALILAAARPVSGATMLKVLAPVDMVLHSATHLFINEEFSHGLRDLSDLDLLMRQFGGDANFWSELLARAQQLDLGRLLFYALRYTKMILDTPIPATAIDASDRNSPGSRLLRLMDALWSRALRSPHPTAGDAFTPLALFLLYLRAHWMRMPPLMLLRHLSVKAFMRLTARDEATTPA